MNRIEIIVPCYNEEPCIRPLYEAVEEVFKKISNYDWSLLYVNDGSSDGTLAELKALKADKGDKVQYISFARNFGKESAIYAGLKNSTGELMVLMDADLQHPPALIPEMIQGIEEGYDCCGARRVSRKGEPVIRSAFSRMFYGTINHMTEMRLVQGGSDYRMMTRQMVDSILLLTERERFSKGIMSWVGFETKWIPYENVERLAGKSKWNFLGLVRYALSGFIAFAPAPLRAMIYFGSVIVIAAVVYAVYLVYNAIRYPENNGSGFGTIVLLILFFGGVLVTLLGVIGEYVARIYMELKHRPIYIEKINTTKKARKDPGED